MTGEWSLILLVGIKPGLTVSEYADQSGMSLSGVSRVFIQLSDIRRTTDVGPELIQTTINLYNRRQKNVTLTAKGQRLFKAMTDSLQGQVRNS